MALISKRGGISAGHRVGLRYKHLRGVWGASGGSLSAHQLGIIGGARGARQQGISWASSAHHRGASGGSEQGIIRGLRGALSGASAGVEGALSPHLVAVGREGEREGGAGRGLKRTGGRRERQGEEGAERGAQGEESGKEQGGRGARGHRSICEKKGDPGQPLRSVRLVARGRGRVPGRPVLASAGPVASLPRLTAGPGPSAVALRAPSPPPPPPCAQPPGARVCPPLFFCP